MKIRFANLVTPIGSLSTPANTVSMSLWSSSSGRNHAARCVMLSETGQVARQIQRELELLFHMNIGFMGSMCNPAKKEKVICRPCIHHCVVRRASTASELNDKMQIGVAAVAIMPWC